MKSLFLSLLFVGGSAFAAHFDVDSAHTQMGFDIQHMMISHVHGRFDKFEGKFDFDEAKRELSNVEVSVDAKSIDTSDKKRDGHLMSPDFFDADKYPKITFKSNKTVNFSEKIAKVPGTLTIHGVSKPVVLEVQDVGTATDPMGNYRLGFTATANINRRDFGLNWNKNLDKGGVLIGDDVEMKIEGEAIRAKK